MKLRRAVLENTSSESGGGGADDAELLPCPNPRSIPRQLPRLVPAVPSWRRQALDNFNINFKLANLGSTLVLLDVVASEHSVKGRG